MIKRIPVNDEGRRIGEGHHLAKLCDHDIDLIRELYDTGQWGYRRLAAKFEVSRWYVRSVVKCRTRGQFADRFKTVPGAVAVKAKG